MNLQTARKARGYTQKQLGEMIGVSHSQISLWESGQKVPSEEDIYKLELALNTSLPYPESLAGDDSPFNEYEKQAFNNFALDTMKHLGEERAIRFLVTLSTAQKRNLMIMSGHLLEEGIKDPNNSKE